MLTDLYPVYAAQNNVVLGNARRSTHFAPGDRGPLCRPCPSAGNCNPSMAVVLDLVQDGLSRAVHLNGDLRL